MVVWEKLKENEVLISEVMTDVFFIDLILLPKRYTTVLSDCPDCPRKVRLEVLLWNSLIDLRDSFRCFSIRLYLFC